MMVAFITIKSSLVPLIEGLCSQIYFRFEKSVVLLTSQYTRFSTIGWKQLVETTADFSLSPALSLSLCLFFCLFLCLFLFFFLSLRTLFLSESLSLRISHPKNLFLSSLSCFPSLSLILSLSPSFLRSLSSPLSDDKRKTSDD